MPVSFGRERYNLTHSHYRRYSGNPESHEPETYPFLYAQCPSSWCFLDIPHWMPFEQSSQAWKFTSCQSTPRHGPWPRKHYHQLHGLTFLLSPSCCLQWPRRSCNLAFILSLHPHWQFPSTRTFAGVLDQVPWCPPCSAMLRLLVWFTDLSTVEFAHTLHLRAS